MLSSGIFPRDVRDILKKTVQLQLLCLMACGLVPPPPKGSEFRPDCTCAYTRTWTDQRTRAHTPTHAHAQRTQMHRHAHHSYTNTNTNRTYAHVHLDTHTHMHSHRKERGGSGGGGGGGGRGEGGGSGGEGGRPPDLQTSRHAEIQRSRDPEIQPTYFPAPRDTNLHKHNCIKPIETISTKATQNTPPPCQKHGPCWTGSADSFPEQSTDWLAKKG